MWMIRRERKRGRKWRELESERKEGRGREKM